MTDPDSDRGRGGSAVGRAARGRRPPLTRERRISTCRLGRAGSVVHPSSLVSFTHPFSVVHPSALARGSLVTDPDSDRGRGGQPWAGRLGAADPR